MKTFLLSWLFLALGILLHELFSQWRGLWRLYRHPAGSQANPDFAQAQILVSARNEALTLPAFFEAMAAQEWPREKLRLILVDDASSDDTRTVIQRELEHWPGSLLLQGQGRGKIHALAQAAAAADDGPLLFTDADCRPCSGWVRAHMQMLRDPVQAVDVSCGHVRVEGKGWAGSLEAVSSFLSSLQVLSGVGRQNPGFARGGNWAMQRSALQRAGGYAGLEGFGSGDDVHLTRRLVHSGARFGYTGQSASHVRTAMPENPAARRQQLRRRYGKIPVLEQRERLRQVLLGIAFSGFLGVVPIALLVLLILGQSPLLPLLTQSWLGALALLLLALVPVVELAIRLLDEGGNRWRLLLLLPVQPLQTVLYGLWGSLGGYSWKGHHSRANNPTHHRTAEDGKSE